MELMDNYIPGSGESPYIYREVMDEMMQQQKEDQTSRQLAENFPGMREFMEMTKPQEAQQIKEDSEVKELKVQEVPMRELTQGDIAKIKESIDPKEVSKFSHEYWEAKITEAEGNKNPEEMVKYRECAELAKLYEAVTEKAEVLHKDYSTKSNQEYQEANQLLKNYIRMLKFASHYTNGKGPISFL